MSSWVAVLVLGVVCTGVAYILFFRLIARLGPSKAITVTFLVPLTAMIFGALFLKEVISIEMLLGCGLILVGTALATGFVKRGRG
jgi:drug/metabolite transporter (DMT)-like permease